MEKIKNFLKPGKSQDDETLYGSGQHTGTTSGLTGEGSHLASSTGNTSGLAGSQTAGTAGTSGIGSTSAGVPSEASTGQAGTGLSSATGTGYGQTSTGTSGLAGKGSHLPGARDTTSGTTSGLIGNQKSGLTSNPISGLTGNQTSGLGASNTTGTGPSNMARDAAITAAGTTPGSTGFPHNQPGLSSSTASSQMPGGWDDTYDRAPGKSRLTGSNTTTGLGSTTSNTAYPSTTQGSNTATDLGSAAGNTGHPSTTQATSQLGSSTASSGLQNPNASTGHHLGRDAAALGAAGAVGEGIHHHRENEPGHGTATVFPTTTTHKTQLGSSSTYPSTTSATEQLGYNSGLPDRTLGSQQPGATTGYGQTGNPSSGHHLGREAAALGAAGAVGEGINHHHHHEHDRGLGNPGTQATQPLGTGNEYTGTSRSMPLMGYTATSGSQPLGSTTAYGNNPSGNPTSGHHLGRDVAALGAAGAVGEGIHHHREHEHGLGSGVASSAHTYGLTSRPHSTDTANLLDPNLSGGARTLENANVHSPHHGGGAEAADKDHIPGATTTGSSSHYLGLGRDAAIGAGGVGALGLAEQERNKHHSEGSGLGNTSGISEPTTGTATSRTDPTTGRDHHYGRDTAIGAGAVGAAGLAEHEHRKHENEKASGIGNTSSTTNSNTIGSSTADPYTSSTSTGRDHHLGRDAAIGAGGLGAAGLAGREYEKHRDNTTGDTSTGLDQTSPGTSSLPGPAPNTAGPHSKDWMNKLDPRVIANPTVAQGNPQAESVLSSQKPSAETGGYGAGDARGTTAPGQSGHHYGRDAALAGGVGAAAYEAEKHHQHQHGVNDPTHTGQPSSATVAGNTYPATSATTGNFARDPTKKDHHLGRDAAIAGGVGGAAYEAEKHHKHDKDLTQSERDAKKEHKHEEKEARKEKKGGLLGFLHRDKNKKYTPEEEAEFDCQEHEHNSHKGRDAALGAAGVGALGAGAYEAEKHHQGHQTGAATDKPLPNAPGSNRVGTGAGPQNVLAGDNATTGQSGHHLGRDAALGASAAGAAGFAAHEHDQHQHGATPLAHKPVGQDLGDKLHGPERYRGVPGSSGIPGTEGYGDGAVGGGAGSHVHSEATTDQYGNPIDPLNDGRVGPLDHPLGRDAVRNDTTLGARDVGAAGVGAHEHGKHHRDRQPESATGYDNTTSGSGLTGSHQQDQHHYGRDAAALGGAVALGEHEHRKHEGTGHYTGSGLTGSGNQYDNTGLGYGQQQSGTTGYGSNTQDLDSSGHNLGPSVVEGSDGRHRLHKDPPASHPAAQAMGGGDMGRSPHVTQSGSETQRVMELGRDTMGRDTGVANPGNERTNY